MACITLVAYDLRALRTGMVQNLSTQARMVGYNSSAALLFGVSQSATENLAALSAEPEIISAVIYRADGKVFASYRRDPKSSDTPGELPIFSPSDGHRFNANHLELWSRIVFSGNLLGTVAIRADLKPLWDRRLKYIGMAALLLLISAAASLLVSQWFQLTISRPILDLAATAQRVSSSRDFSLRAKIASRDEVGLLVETFNEMLGHIEEQNAALQKARDELEHRVIERTVQLEAANKELEAFSYSVSHDLRAPLRAIDGFSQAVLEDYAEKLDAQGRDYLDRVRAATQQMAQLIDDMLGLARVTRGDMKREAVNLSEIARSICKQLQNENDGRNVECVIAEELNAFGDARLLRVALANLLSNAWKFTSKTAAAKIEVGVTEISGERAYFVRDNGAGFDMAYASKLFGAFQRLHAVTEFHGTGIGLATVQRVIHRHGGRTWAEGEVDRGATFYFTLG